MIAGITLKICGLTSLLDAEFAAKSGAKYLGFIFHPASPRALTLEKYRRFASGLSGARKVAVSVEPNADALAAMKEAGFDFFQIHFRHGLPDAQVAAWSGAVGAERLWLAPSLPPTAALPERLLPFASTFLLDTFDARKFGGTGRTGDWEKFARARKAHRGKTWILSGGLGAENIVEGVRASGARFVDVSSGVESAPGVKDHAKISALVQAIATIPT
ncbi:MAG: Phosphoribosylanthranilate isomerase [Verrucomicrobia bacterium]|nr:Phosphoribosylanthranilate isomerase [Verrucomicrobiota bacterium]